MSTFRNVNESQRRSDRPNAVARRSHPITPRAPQPALDVGDLTGEFLRLGAALVTLGFVLVIALPH